MRRYITAFLASALVASALTAAVPLTAQNTPRWCGTSSSRRWVSGGFREIDSHSCVAIGGPGHFTSGRAIGDSSLIPLTMVCPVPSDVLMHPYYVSSWSTYIYQPTASTVLATSCTVIPGLPDASCQTAVRTTATGNTVINSTSSPGFTNQSGSATYLIVLTLPMNAGLSYVRVNWPTC